MYRLRGVVRDYAWGDECAIPRLLGRPATGAPVAEYWLGAHGTAPAGLETADGRPAGDLSRLIAHDPVGVLGEPVVDRYGQRLPYLLKLLAARRALSIQVHPTQQQAEVGYARENAQGLALDAPTRSFKDPWHKPELLLALAPFQALCGFRHPREIAEAVAGLAARLAEAGGRGRVRAHDLRALEAWRAALSEPDPAVALRESLALLVGDAYDYAGLADRLAALVREQQAAALLVRLQADYPGDAGVLVALMLNQVDLRPGQALALGAGVPHAYLHGLGVEIMAGSDNVVRCGLTKKHVDTGLLRELVDYHPLDVRPLEPDAQGRLPTDFDDFALRAIAAQGPAVIDGPAIVLCLDGAAVLSGGAAPDSTAPDSAGTLHLARGQAAFIAAAEGPVHAQAAGRLVVATVGAGV